MIVCVCNAIREEEIRGVAKCGARCPHSAYAALGCEPQCGMCLPYAQEIVDEVHAEMIGEPRAEAPEAERLAA